MTHHHRDEITEVDFSLMGDAALRYGLRWLIQLTTPWGETLGVAKRPKV
jgi:hypothetical protein